MTDERYKAITVQDLVDLVKSQPEMFPKGLDTVVMTADFESNYLHEKHELYHDKDKSKYGNFVVMCYEMHENYDDYVRGVPEVHND